MGSLALFSERVERVERVFLNNMLTVRGIMRIMLSIVLIMLSTMLGTIL